MKPIWIFIIVLFFAGFYVHLNYSTSRIQEGFGPRCPNILIQNGNEIWLKNTNLAEIPGVNPIVFHNLEEYTQFIDWQHSQKINCPILFLQKSYSTQNDAIYKIKPIPKQLTDATRNQPPYNTNSYPGIDPTNQDIGEYTMLDEYHEVGESQPQSADPMDPNWGGVKYTSDQIKAGVYKDNEILK